jgi:seryl-tRNA synthetase
MLDITLLRKDLASVVARLETRESPQRSLDVARFGALESERKALQTRTEELQARRNVLSREIGKLKGQGGDAAAAMTEVAEVGNELDRSAERLAAIQLELAAQLMALPNLPHPSVPVGADERANVELRRWGTPRTFDFTPRDHVDVGTPLGLDLETGAKLSGSALLVPARAGRAAAPRARAVHARRADGRARLHRVLHAVRRQPRDPRRHGAAAEVQGPDVLGLPRRAGRRRRGRSRRAASSTSSRPPRSRSPTAFASRLLAEASLPIKLTAHTPCFRSEAGSAGRDTRGMIRQHQFDKVEMVQIVHPERSYAALDEMVGHAEAVLRKLELPYRVVELATGDLGFGSAKTFDLEVWVPAQNTYREISSCSNCEAFQARRMQTRFKTAQGKNEFVHTLNGSGLAVGRTLVAVLENYQNADGSVTIPAALRPYLGGIDALRA